MTTNHDQHPKDQSSTSESATDQVVWQVDGTQTDLTDDYLTDEEQLLVDVDKETANDEVDIDPTNFDPKKNVVDKTGFTSNATSITKKVNK